MSLLLGGFLLLGVVYIVLGILAYQHIESDDFGDRLRAAGPWWALEKQIYDHEGQVLCTWGRWIILADCVLIAWYFVVG